MLIGARLETHIVALRSLVARNAVRQYDLIGISDMRFAGSIGNRSCHIKFSFIAFLTHNLISSLIL